MARKRQPDLPARLKAGTVHVGPDFYGCINTGHAPAILKSRNVDRYFVGCQMDVEDAWRQVAFNASNASRRKLKVNERVVWAFKTRAPAVAKFKELVAEQMRTNADEEKRHRKAMADATSSDPRRRMKGASELLDS